MQQALLLAIWFTIQLSSFFSAMLLSAFVLSSAICMLLPYCYAALFSYLLVMLASSLYLALFSSVWRLVCAVWTTCCSLEYVFIWTICFAFFNLDFIGEDNTILSRRAQNIFFNIKSDDYTNLWGEIMKPYGDNNSQRETLFQLYLGI